VTVVSLVLSLPNLEVMSIHCDEIRSGKPFSSYPVTPQRTPLKSLGLRGDVGRLGEAFAKSKLTSRRLSLEVDTPGVEQLITLSAETVVELELGDGFDGEIPHPIYPLSFPVLTTLIIGLCVGRPSSLTDILRYIPPTPTLTSIRIVEYNWWVDIKYPSSGDWDDLDSWLARMAGHARVEGGLSVVLSGWPEDKPVWEGFLDEFRKAGGKIETERDAAIGYCDDTWDDL